MQQKTVFISYRRDLSKHLARSIYMDLRANNWDVFLDVNTIDSGDFDRIILNQIGARAHFILIISKGSLARCANVGDWVLREIEEAVTLGRNIVPIVEEDADFTAEIAYLPEKLRAIIGKKNALPLPHFFFDPAMEMLRTRFLKTPARVVTKEAPLTDIAEVQKRLQQVEADIPTEVKPTSKDIMPAPFDWIDIPDKGYSIAKYPVTNAQFAKFIDAGGYETERWWTKEGWKKRIEGWHLDNGWKASGVPWTEPRYWTNSKWNDANQPVVGVSRYECIAFCVWLSKVTGEKIMLPTESQWQYAAQGDDGRTYPWGDVWDCRRCNNSVKPCDSRCTTPVTHYEDSKKQSSPFGTVDMVGNVWEWCLSDYTGETKNNINETSSRVLRGGSWNNLNSDNFRCDYRIRYNPQMRIKVNGFRLVRA